MRVSGKWIPPPHGALAYRLVKHPDNCKYFLDFHYGYPWMLQAELYPSYLDDKYAENEFYEIIQPLFGHEFRRTSDGGGFTYSLQFENS